MWLLHVYSRYGYVNQISGTPIEPDLAWTCLLMFFYVNVTVHYTYCKFVDKKPVLVVVLFLVLCREQFWKCYFKFLLVAWLDVYVRVMMILC